MYKGSYFSTSRTVGLGCCRCKVAADFVLRTLQNRNQHETWTMDYCKWPSSVLIWRFVERLGLPLVAIPPTFQRSGDVPVAAPLCGAQRVPPNLIMRSQQDRHLIVVLQPSKQRYHSYEADFFVHTFPRKC